MARENARIRREAERLVLAAVRLYERSWAQQGGPAAPGAIYGWTEPKPPWYSLESVVRAARRLEQRGELVGVPGRPRRYRLPK